MSKKPIVEPDEMKMQAGSFDEIMRQALGAPAPSDTKPNQINKDALKNLKRIKRAS